MTTVTLEQVQAEQARLAKLIEQLQTPAPKLLVLREAQIEMQPGERYAGLVLTADGFASHLLYNRISPRFHARFTADSCACIPGRGTLYAARRLEHQVRSATANWARATAPSTNCWPTRT